MEYVQCAKEHPLHYQIPRLSFFFYNAVTQPIAEEFRDLGITVYGQVVAVSPDIQKKLDVFEDSDSDDTSEPSTDTISEYYDQGLEDSDLVTNVITVTPNTRATYVSLSSSSSTLAESSSTPWLPDFEADVNIKSATHRMQASNHSEQVSNSYHDPGKRDHISDLVCIHCDHTSSDVNVRSNETCSSCEGTRCQSEATVASVPSSCNDEHGNAVCLCTKVVCPENTHTSKQKTAKCGFPCSGQDACNTILAAADDVERDAAESLAGDMIWPVTGINKQSCDLKNRPSIMNFDSSVIFFYQNVCDTLKLDCTVQSIYDAALFESSPIRGDGYNADASERCPEPISAINKVNLDITSLITLVSSVCHGGCHVVFQEDILSQQAEEERRSPVVPKLLQFMEGGSVIN